MGKTEDRGTSATTSVHDALKGFVSRLRARSTLSDDAVASVLAWPGELRAYGTNHDVLVQGKIVNSACLIASGRAGRYDQTAEGDRQITAIYLPGDMADLHSVTIPRVSSGLQALTRCVVAHIPHRAIIDGARAHADLADALWRDTVADAFILSQWLLNNGRRSARSRLAHLMCELAARGRAQAGGGGDRIDLQLTQVQLADALGLTSVHVNRMMRALSDDGVIQVNGRVIDVLDWQRLTRVGDFNPAYLHLRDPGPQGDGAA